MLSPSQEETIPRLPGLHFGLALLVLATSLCITAASVIWLRSDLNAKADGRFERQADAIDDSIRT